MEDFPFHFAPTSLNALIIIFTLAALAFVIWKPSGKKKVPLPPQVGGAWPVIGHVPFLAGSQPAHKTLGSLADKYGPIFTIKLGLHRALVISNWEMAKECLTTNDKVFANRPKSLAMAILGYNYSMPGFSPYGPYWRQMRKILTLELLSNHRLDMLQHVREAEVKAAIKGLYHQWTMTENKNGNSKRVLVEMKGWFWNITLNVILKIIVGKKFVECGSLNNDDQDKEVGGGWRDSLREFMELSGMFVVSDALPFLRWLDLGGAEKAMKKTLKELDHFVQGWLEEHKHNKVLGIAKNDEDFMDVMLSILDEPKELSGCNSDTINKAVCLALIVAASDTTAITLTWTLSLLLNNPNVLKKAQQELDIHVGRERQVKESDTRNLIYLQAIIKESFRLYPAAPLSLPHESMDDCTVGGYHVPSGTRLILNLSKIHQDPRIWLDPYEFEPERFLTTHKDIDFKGQNFELIPFGSGRRMCPGISFALQVLNLTLATLLHGFEIETPSEKPIDMSESNGLTNFKATPLEVLLCPRLPADVY